MLKGKTVLLGVTGGIAAYKAAALASALVKQHASVEVIMTAHATQFIAPLTFEQLTGTRCMVDTFDRNFSHQVEHIALADRTDLVIIAPATANVCAKLAHGLADDMLTTTVLACACPKLAAPAMNTKMFENPVTQDNLDALRRYGWEVIAPASGRLACGAVGPGKLPEPEDLLQHIGGHPLHPQLALLPRLALPALLAVHVGDVGVLEKLRRDGPLDAVPNDKPRSVGVGEHNQPPPPGRPLQKGHSFRVLEDLKAPCLQDQRVCHLRQGVFVVPALHHNGLADVQHTAPPYAVLASSSSKVVISSLASCPVDFMARSVWAQRMTAFRHQGKENRRALTIRRSAG